MKNKLVEFIKANKVKIIIIAVIIIIFLAMFLLGRLSAGKDINYIPV